MSPITKEDRFFGMKIRHKADLINEHGGVSALCFDKPRAINLKTAMWVLQDQDVTCPKCLERLGLTDPVGESEKRLERQRKEFE